METLLETKIATELKPSLLRQIVDEVDMMDDEGKAQILKRIKGEKAVAKARAIDERFKGAFKEMTEDEICEMVSIDRKKWYEESLNR